ncbi:hypothetical protein MVES1_002495 [Malassezia vespertilionis]|uniref:RING-type domain-containing protein n=1 Tax=Malassezia vespertilionis TaxID=2020962 RepID=A0A2N1JA02_9BASI|nr:uncharacterized protein MVES1_002495 [Malassezia vespertilionis]PKI83386.1 hypothetical protein MVES_002354 [Malassezia vespertilionis]WFD07138.1 hypothetical protein MVES1_002495 [Malassezia vespertilionis]
MGSAQSRSAREHRRARDEQQEPVEAETRTGLRRGRDDAPNSPTQSDLESSRRRRRLSLGRVLGVHGNERGEAPTGSTSFRAPIPRAVPIGSRVQSGWGRSGAYVRAATQPPEQDMAQTDDTTHVSQSEVPETSLDPLHAERRETIQMIERVLGRRIEPILPPNAQPRERSISLPDTGQDMLPETEAPSSPHPRLNSRSLRGTFPHFEQMGPRRVRRPSNLGQNAPFRSSSALGTLLSEVIGASRAARHGAAGAPLSGTSVIVQGALVARTTPSAGASTEQTSHEAQTDPVANSDATQAAPGTQGMPGVNSPPHVASLEEQAEMLGRIIRIATAATAASLVNNTSPPPEAAQEAPPNNSGLRSELLGRLVSFSNRVRSTFNSQEARNEPQFAEEQAQQPSETEAMSTISRLMREALRTTIPSDRSSTPPETMPAEPLLRASILDMLEHARQGQALTEGDPGTFERFLHDLIVDLNAAVPCINHDAVPGTDEPTEPREDETGAEASTRIRREGDLSCGQLSFFRLHRFDPAVGSPLIPCVLVGVRSLRADERLVGSDDPMLGRPAQPSAPGNDTNAASPDAGNTHTMQANAGTSRFVLFVSGGRYQEDHPLLTSQPRDAGRDLMFMMELLGTMAAMSAKPRTATASDIARSGLARVRANELAALRDEGKVTENTSEKCLVCLEDWEAEDDCRILSCQHVFHAECVDKWLEESSNSCPLCRSQAVAMQ